MAGVLFWSGGSGLAGSGLAGSGLAL